MFLQNRQAFGRILLAVFILFTTFQSETFAGSLGICTGQPSKAEETLTLPLYEADNTVKTLVFSPDSLPESCTSHELPLLPHDVAWIGLLKNTPPSTQEITGFYLQGRGDMFHPPFSLSELSSMGPPSAIQETSPAMQAFPLTKNPVHLGTWVWRAADWQENPLPLIEHTHRLGITRLFIYIPMQINPEPAIPAASELTSFVEEATRHQIEVWCVLGDPTHVKEEGLSKLLERVKQLARYNDSVASSARIRGIQLDIEPYLLPEYAGNPAAWHQRYVTAIQTIHGATPLPLDVALPHWFHRRNLPDGRRVIDALTPYVTRITVMDYVTQPQALLRNMEPFLEWGLDHHREVQMALELGPLPDEQAWRFYPTRGPGQLWLIPLQNRIVALVLKSPRSSPLGDVFRLSDTRPTPVPASRVTFHHNKATLKTLIPQLVTQLSTWPSFSGVVLHAYPELTFTKDRLLPSTHPEK